MITRRKRYCSDRMCGADDCSNCRGEGSYNDNGDEVEDYDEQPDGPEDWDDFNDEQVEKNRRFAAKMYAIGILPLVGQTQPDMAEAMQNRALQTERE